MVCLVVVVFTLYIDMSNGSPSLVYVAPFVLMFSLISHLKNVSLSVFPSLALSNYIHVAVIWGIVVASAGSETDTEQRVLKLVKPHYLSFFLL